MRDRYCLLALAIGALVMLAAANVGAQFYAVDNYYGYVYSYEDTVATRVNPDTLVPYVEAAAVDHQGRLVLGVLYDEFDVVRLDIDAQTIDYIDYSSPAWTLRELAMDIGDDIYVLMEETGLRGPGDGGRYVEDFVGVIHGGSGSADTAYALPPVYPIDIAVRPSGPNAGNVLVLYDDDGPVLIELERTGPTELTYVGQIAGGGMLPSDATAIAVDPSGTIIVLDYTDGLFYIEEYYGYVWGFGDAVGPGLEDLAIGADGTIYVANRSYDRIQWYGSDGYSLGPPFGQDLIFLGGIAAVGYTPTPEGEDVLVEPGENIEVTYEEVTASGFTTAVVETTANRVSPEGNLLPDHAQLPGTRVNYFTYIGLATDATYEGLIQVDVLEEGSRLFYASGVGDTFRDFTVVGSIDDARGTIPRFEELPYSGGKRVETGPTEVVLVEDDRALSDVTKYKFWRLDLAMTVPDNMPGSDPCPWEFIKWLRKYPESAREYYDVADYTNALSELAVMNSMIRSHAGWCIPDSSDDPEGNIVAHILAHSKTLMFSIGLEAGIVFTGIEEVPSTVSLAVTSPARGECRMVLSGPVGAEVAARIYSVSGRLVATVYEGRLSEGGETIIWNGIDSGGRPVASGVYFARVESDGRPQVSKVVYIR
jgi:hypothetical protein